MLCHAKTHLVSVQSPYSFSCGVMLCRLQVSGAGDEDDVADEQLFMQESLELHYNVAELVGTYWKMRLLSATAID